MAAIDEQQTKSSCPFSVEVVASASNDGSMRSIDQVSTTEKSASSQHCPEPLEGPALVRVTSNSDSEHSSEVDEDGGIIEAFEIEALLDREDAITKESSVVPADDSGIYDCLSDQLSNLFCPVDQRDVLHRSSGDTKAEAKQLAYCFEARSCHEVATTSCTEMQFQDILDVANPGNDVFSSLQFWLTPSQEEELTSGKSNVPQNRSFSRRRKVSYISRLWNDWHPENTIPIERSGSMPTKVRPTISDIRFRNFYDSDPEQQHKDKRQRKESLISKRHFTRHRPPTIQTSFDSESLSFDWVKRCPPTPRNSEQQFNFENRPCSSIETPLGNLEGPSFFDSPVALSDFDITAPDGDEFLKQFVQEVTNARIQLVWHRATPPSKDVSDEIKADTSSKRRPKLRAPKAVTGIFEVGAHLDNLVVQPKFVWSPTNEPSLKERKIQLSGVEPDGIELLSIVRVTVPQDIDRKQYPFARLDRTCCIFTNDEKFPYLVFEAGSSKERDWLVTALKMIVARLASIIIVRDENMLMEFFSPYSALMSLADGQDFDDDQEPSGCDGNRSVGSSTARPTLESNGELQLLSFDN